jgi:hypothetical protein
MSESIGNSEWVSVADAAGAARLPLRTVYNWVKSESIASRQRDGVTLVRLDEVMTRVDAIMSKRGGPVALSAIADDVHPPALQGDQWRTSPRTARLPTRVSS